MSTHPLKERYTESLRKSSRQNKSESQRELPRRPQQGTGGEHEQVIPRSPKLPTASSSLAQQKDTPGLTASARSQNRLSVDAHEFERRTAKPPKGRRLWNPEEQQPCSPRSSNTKPSRDTSSAQRVSLQSNEKSALRLIRELKSKSIGPQQLVKEVKNIYRSLVLVERKCIDVDTLQLSKTNAKHVLSREQWQALIALHRTLLHEHHDFLLASQHPSANAALRGLGHKCFMPARLWRHGIHSFLELLRNKLPDSLEYMITFIYLSYSFIALLYEKIPPFEDTWVECLGDLGRYRIAIEDEDITERENWTEVSRGWYLKASEMSPCTGRLYHHLAILARLNVLQQLFYYLKSLCVRNCFPSTNDSIMTLFNPVLTTDKADVLDMDATFVRIHGILFSGQSDGQLSAAMDQFLTQLTNTINRISKAGRDWQASQYSPWAGYYMGISLCCSLLGYGSRMNVIMREIIKSSGTAKDSATAVEGLAPDVEGNQQFEKALSFFVQTFQIMAQRSQHDVCLSYLHTTLVFLLYVSDKPEIMHHLETKHPWPLTAKMLNDVKAKCEEEEVQSDISSDAFPRPPANEPLRPLPEDYALRGLIYCEDFFPDDWFSNSQLDEDAKYFDLPSMAMVRRERMLWVGGRIAKLEKWLRLDDETGQFSAVTTI